MLPLYDNEKYALPRVKAFLKSGTLGTKKAEIDAIMVAGDTMYFRGEVSWCVEVVEDGRLLRGHSESLDHAFSDIESVLFMLSDNYDDDVRVNLSLQKMEAA